MSQTQLQTASLNMASQPVSFLSHLNSWPITAHFAFICIHTLGLGHIQSRLHLEYACRLREPSSDGKICSCKRIYMIWEIEITKYTKPAGWRHAVPKRKVQNTEALKRAGIWSCARSSSGKTDQLGAPRQAWLIQCKKIASPVYSFEDPHDVSATSGCHAS